MRRHITAGILLGLLAVGAPAFAQEHPGVTHRISTYTPTPGARTHAQVDAYSQRGSAIAPSPSWSGTHRGGGPAANVGASARTPYGRMFNNAHWRLRGRTMSDSQTRRPGAINYAPQSQKDGCHGAMGGCAGDDTTGVPMSGDDFRTRREPALTSPVARDDEAREPNAWIHQDMANVAERASRGAADATLAAGDELAPTALAADPTFARGVDTALYGRLRVTQGAVLSSDDVAALPAPFRTPDRDTFPRDRAPRIESASFVSAPAGISSQPVALGARLQYPAEQRAIIAESPAPLALSGTIAPALSHRGAIGGGPRSFSQASPEIHTASPAHLTSGERFMIQSWIYNQFVHPSSEGSRR